MKISFVVPCYNSEKTIVNVVEEIKNEVNNNLNKFEIEIILVNDCSKDKTKQIIFNLADHNTEIIAVDLAKNAGQHAAILAGMNLTEGDFLVILDDDGQTPVENLHLMLDKMVEGYDVVSAKYVAREGRSLFRRFGSQMSKVMSKWLIDKPEGVNVSAFVVLKRFVVNEIIKYKEPFPFLSGLILRTTHNVGNVEMIQKKRECGKSGYNFRKLMKLWLNGFTAFSIKPLRIATVLGITIAFFGFIYAFVILFQKIIGNNVPIGWSSIIIAITIIGGLILFVLGLIGEYVGRIYLSINNTPQYVIREISK